MKEEEDGEEDSGDGQGEGREASTRKWREYKLRERGKQENMKERGDGEREAH